MATILFVHGTGVRKSAYEKSLALINQKAQTHLPCHRIEGCAWGDAFGAKLNAGGTSIINYTQSGNAQPSLQAAQDMRWHLLSQDPLLELRLLPDEDVALTPPGPMIWASFPNLATDPGILRVFGPDHEAWSEFILATASNTDWCDTVSGLKQQKGALAETVARALSAGYFSFLREANYPGPTGEQRNELMSALKVYLGGAALGIRDWLLGRLTNRLLPRRGSISDVTGPAVGDILRYQARGEALREFIGHEVERTGASILLAHSLGGVAAVDWLASKPRGIRTLITAGSQAPYFYEIDALASRAFGKGLPDFFPEIWLNFLDPRDFLSYQGRHVFGSRVTDVVVDNGQAFPESHSAYWNNDGEVWGEIGRVVGQYHG